MNFWVSKILPALCCVLFFSGCMSFDYVGQSFAPRSESMPVNIIQGRDRIPAGQYRIIGRGILRGPQTTDEYDRHTRLRDEARRRGADAVCVVSLEVKPEGFYPQSDGAFAPPLAAGVNVDNLNSRNTAWETDSFGQVQTLSGEAKLRYSFTEKVIFLKKISDFDKEMKTRSSFL